MKSVHQLDATALLALKDLLNACRTVDGAAIPTYSHLLKTFRPGAPSLLLYDDDKLVGFLALFYFYEDAVEISLMIHPKHRGQGFARCLWEHTLPHLKNATYIKRLLVTSPQVNHPSWLLQKAFVFQHTEYDMACTPSAIPGTMHAIRLATAIDVDALCMIDAACFNAKRPDPSGRIEKLIQTPNVNIFVLLGNEKIIGQVHLVFEENVIRLTDLAVLPEMQKQGLGRALLSFALDYAHSNHQEKMTLCVAALNKQALKLYENMGFKTYNAVDYYEKSF